MASAAQALAAKPVPLFNIGQFGVISDVPPPQLPPEAWSRASNVEFQNKNARRARGYAATFGTPSVAPSFIMNVPGANDATFWLYFSLLKAYVFESATHTEITNTGGDYATAAGRDWVGTLLAGVPIVTNNADPPQWWPAASSGQELEDLPDWPSGYKCKSIRAFGSYVFAINLTKTATPHEHAILVSHKADPGSVPASWDAADAAVDAIEFELTDIKGGEALDGLPLGQQMILYKKNSTHYARFIGGDEVWQRDKLFDAGILATRCVCTIKKGTQHFVVTQDDAIVHGGGKEYKSVVDGLVRETLFGDLDPTNYVNSFCFEVPEKEQVWFAYPATGATLPNKALVYNWGDGTCVFRDFEGSFADSGVLDETEVGDWSDTGTWESDTTTWGGAGRLGIVACDPTATKFWQLETGYAYGVNTPVSFLERTGLAIVGRDRQGQPKEDFISRKMLNRIWVNAEGEATLQVYAAAQELDAGPITWTGPVPFTIGSDQFVDIVTAGRLLGVKFENAQNVSWQLNSYRLQMAQLGEY